MKLSAASTVAFFAGAALAAAVPSPHTERAVAPETIYLANCADTAGNVWSEVSYYKEGHCSTAACGAQENYPDDQYYMTPRVGKGPPFNWEGREVTAPFASGVAFTFKIDANAQKSNDFETVGWGQNKFHHYSCKKDNKRELWHASGGGFAASCKSIYYCLVGN